MNELYILQKHGSSMFQRAILICLFSFCSSEGRNSFQQRFDLLSDTLKNILLQQFVDGSHVYEARNAVYDNFSEFISELERGNNTESVIKQFIVSLKQIASKDLVEIQEFNPKKIDIFIKQLYDSYLGYDSMKEKSQEENFFASIETYTQHIVQKLKDCHEEIRENLKTSNNRFRSVLNDIIKRIDEISGHRNEREGHSIGSNETPSTTRLAPAPLNIQSLVSHLEDTSFDARRTLFAENSYFSEVPKDPSAVKEILLAFLLENVQVLKSFFKEERNSSFDRLVLRYKRLLYSSDVNSLFEKLFSKINILIRTRDSLAIKFPDPYTPFSKFCLKKILIEKILSFSHKTGYKNARELYDSLLLSSEVFLISNQYKRIKTYIDRAKYSVSILTTINDLRQKYGSSLTIDHISTDASISKMFSANPSRHLDPSLFLKNFEGHVTDDFIIEFVAFFNQTVESAAENRKRFLEDQKKRFCQEIIDCLNNSTMDLLSHEKQSSWMCTCIQNAFCNTIEYLYLFSIRESNVFLNLVDSFLKKIEGILPKQAHQNIAEILFQNNRETLETVKHIYKNSLGVFILFELSQKYFEFQKREAISLRSVYSEIFRIPVFIFDSLKNDLERILEHTCFLSKDIFENPFDQNIITFMVRTRKNLLDTLEILSLFERLGYDESNLYYSSRIHLSIIKMLIENVLNTEIFKNIPSSDRQSDVTESNVQIIPVESKKAEKDDGFDHLEFEKVCLAYGCYFLQLLCSYEKTEFDLSKTESYQRFHGRDIIKPDQTILGKNFLFTKIPASRNDSDFVLDLLEFDDHIEFSRYLVFIQESGNQSSTIRLQQ